jgi:hypothetical protein
MNSSPCCAPPGQTATFAPAIDTMTARGISWACCTAVGSSAFGRRNSALPGAMLVQKSKNIISPDGGPKITEGMAV